MSMARSNASISRWLVVSSSQSRLSGRLGFSANSFSSSNSPARNGTSSFGGPAAKTYPYDQILQIYQIWQLGGYVNYHHDMFQTPYGTPPTCDILDPIAEPNTTK